VKKSSHFVINCIVYNLSSPCVILHNIWMDETLRKETLGIGTNPHTFFFGEGARSCETSPLALMNCFGANPPIFRGEGARSCEMSTSPLMNCFGTNPPPFWTKWQEVAKWAPRHLWIALVPIPPFRAKRRGVAKQTPWHLWIALTPIPHLLGRRGEELQNKPLGAYELLCCDVKLQKLYQIVVLRLDVFLPRQVTGLLSCHCASFARISDNTKNLSFYQILVYIEIEKMQVVIASLSACCFALM
jgi:hypothetical protein